MPLFGPSDPNSQGLMSRLFGGGGGGAQPPAAPMPTPASQVAEQTGATASSPFLQYMQQNAPAAKQTAGVLMGDAPKPDYKSALIQAGLGILSQPGDQSPLQAIAKGAQTAMPLYLQEQKKVEDFNKQKTALAAKLNMSAAEFDEKMSGERKGIKCFDGTCIDEEAYQSHLKQNGGDIGAAFNQSVVHKKRTSAEENAKSLARMRQHLEIMKHQPGANPADIQKAQDELAAMEAQVMPSNQKDVTFGWMDENGTFRMASGSPEGVAKGVAQINDAATVKKLQTQQDATDQVLYYASNIMNVFDKADSIFPSGKLGSLASSGAAWAKVLDQSMSGPRKEQFQSEVAKNPEGYIDRLRKDPESRNLLGEGTLDKLSKMGQQNTQALSNMIGLAYATARAQEPGGRLSNSDVAGAMASMGFDPEAWVNDPAKIKSGVLELTKRNLADYERSIDLSNLSPEQKKKIRETDVVLNKRLKEYGFHYTGGINGDLTFGQQPKDAPQKEMTPKADSQGPATPNAAPQGPQSPASPQAEPVKVESRDQYDQLPSGTRFVAPDGSVRTKP